MDSHPPSLPPTSKILSVISPGLRRLLCDEPNNEQAIRWIATDPKALEEVEAVHRMLESAATAPAGPAGVMQVVGRRFALYRQPERSAEESEAWWSDYFDVLAEVPLGTLEAAMIAWVRTAAEFLPKPGQLLALAEEHPGKDALALLRARAAMRWTPPPETPRYVEAPYVEPRKLPEVDRAAIRQMRADFAAQLPERKRPEPRANSAKVDPVTGVSAELRALVARQRGEPIPPLFSGGE